MRIVQAVAEGNPPRSNLELRAIERISEFKRNLRNGLTAFRLDAPRTGDQAKITPTVVQIAEKILARSNTVGAIEGRMDAVNIHGRHRFTIYDAVTGTGTVCHFRHEMLNDVIQAIGKKVLVAGKLRRDFDGKPRDIREITEFRQLGRPDDSPSVLSLEGVYSDIEGDTLHYLAEIRGG